MEAKSTITKEEFIQHFKLAYALAVKEPAIMETYETFAKGTARVRSDCIKYLRTLGVDRETRMAYNDAVQNLAKGGHLKYLFYKDPTCGICTKPILKLMEATIDHIYPRSKGGPNSLDNKQIAHGYCNVRKGDKLGFKMAGSA